MKYILAKQRSEALDQLGDYHLVSAFGYWPYEQQIVQVKDG